MRILGIDTAVANASVALVDDGELIIEAIQGQSRHRTAVHPDVPAGHQAETLLPLIQSVLAESQIGVEALAGIALSIGPGSFTGLRVGLATAKGLAYESGLPLVGVSTLRAHAARVDDSEGVIGVLLDARKGEVYIALFRRCGATLSRLMADELLPIESAIEKLRSFHEERAGSLLLMGDGATAHERQLRLALGHIVTMWSGMGHASAAARAAMLAVSRFAAGSTDDVGALAPVYLRFPAAEIKLKKMPQPTEYLKGKRN